MPNPFPGMNPYLESPRLWRDFHSSFLYGCRTALRTSLPGGYVARLDERIIVTPTANSYYPDVTVLRSRPVTNNRATGDTGGVAVLPEKGFDQPHIIRVTTEQMREPFLEIIALGGTEEVVTVIELLSPTNKASGSEGRAVYLRKQQEILSSICHLVEIDLLRCGKYTVAVPEMAMVAEFGKWDYLYSLHRARQPKVAEQIDEFEALAWSIRQPLPHLPIPLRSPSPDIWLDLQKVLERTYAESFYDESIDYNREPESPLDPRDAEWANRLLHEKGLTAPLDNTSSKNHEI